MNLFKTILLLCFLCAEGAMAQSPVQQFWALNQRKYLLDKLPGASVAYSVRRLSARYAGNAMRVRRNSGATNPEGDVSFDASGRVSGSSLVTITKAGTGYAAGDTLRLNAFWTGSVSIYVVTWYDQSGNGRNVTQATAGLQPRIVNAGVLETSNSIASIRFIQASQTVLQATVAASTMLSSGYIGSASLVLEASAGNTSAFGYGNISDRWQAHMDQTSVVTFDVGSPYQRLSSPSNAAHEGLLRNYLLIAGGTPSLQLYRSGSSIASSTPTLNACTRSDFNIGGIPAFTTYYHNNRISEVLIYPKALTAPMISIVQSDQSTFYSTP